MAVLHPGSHFPMLTSCNSGAVCYELLGFESFLNNSSRVQLPHVHYQQVQRLKWFTLCFSADAFLLLMLSLPKARSESQLSCSSLLQYLRELSSQLPSPQQSSSCESSTKLFHQISE